jgi:hypothetical protein
MRVTLFSCIFVLSLVSCQKKADTQNTPLIESAVPPPAASVVATPPVASSAEPAPAEAVAAAAPAAVNAATAPVEEDFEQKAQATITTSSVVQEIEKLDKEIGK